MRTPFHNYARQTLLRAGALLLGLALFNVAVDPYNYFGLNRLGVYISADRETKSTLVRRGNYDALLIGNSKAAMIPVEQLKGFHFFNAGLGAANAEEMEHFIRSFAHKQKLVVLSIDYGLHGSDRSEINPFVRWRPMDVMTKAFNLRTIEYSVRTITSHFRGIPSDFTADGSYVPDRWFAKYGLDRPAEMRRDLDNLGRAYEVYQRLPGHGMMAFRRIAEILRQRGIRCLAYIPPMHGEVIHHIEALPDYSKFQSWKRELVEIFPDLVDFSNSKYSDPAAFFKSDPVHFLPQVGAEFLNNELLPKFTAAPANTIDRSK